MLEYAKKHELKLKELFWETAFDPFYMYMENYPHREDFELPKDTFSQNSFVSFWQDKIIGYITYQINRPANRADCFSCIHFGKEHSYIFGKDLTTAIRDIFEKYRFNKINFCVVVGNPIEKTYDKLINKYGGRVVGIWKQESRLIDGSLYDLKDYELLADEYYKSINYKKRK